MLKGYIGKVFPREDGSALVISIRYTNKGVPKRTDVNLDNGKEVKEELEYLKKLGYIK